MHYKIVLTAVLANSIKDWGKIPAASMETIKKMPNIYFGTPSLIGGRSSSQLI